LESKDAGEGEATTTVDKFTFRVRRDLSYSGQEVWVKREDGRLRLGLTDFLQQRSGDAAFVEPAEVGRTLTRGETFVRVETIKTIVELPSPVAGWVAAANEVLAEHPELVNEDPYGKGWLVILEDASVEAAGLLDADSYFALLKTKLAEEAGS
jgi:glycine cleavage system H protein